MATKYVSISPAALEDFISRLFQGAGVDPADAAAAAEHLTLAERRGHPSHGLSVISRYLKDIEDGNLARRTEIRVIREAPAVALLDAGKGWGMTAGRRAMEMAMAKARQAGIGLVAVGNCYHIGMAGYYTEIATKAGMIGLTMGMPPREHAFVAPWGGKVARLSTNPISMGVPSAKGSGLILDMATSQAAMGKIDVARLEGQPLKPGWAVDEAGNPTLDANAMKLLLPLGGYKGYGLAAMVELLSGLLTNDPDYPQHKVYLKTFIAINLAFFQPADQATRRVDEWVNLMKSTPRRQDVEEILVPGEPEQRREAASAELVPVGAGTWSEVATLARGLGVSVPTV